MCDKEDSKVIIIDGCEVTLRFSPSNIEAQETENAVVDLLMSSFENRMDEQT